jgi:hypothetical protein
MTRGPASQPPNSESRLAARLAQLGDMRLNPGIPLLLKRGQRLLLFGRQNRLQECSEFRALRR